VIITEEYLCFKLHFRTSVHFGIYSTDLTTSQDYFPSDSLFGAFIFAWSKLFPEKVNKITDQYIKEKPYIISSAFPFIKKEFFFPKIFVKGNFSEHFLEDLSNLKKLKAINWLSKDLFEAWINNEPLNKFENDIFEINTQLSMHIKQKIFPKSSLDRIHQHSQLFYISETFFSENAGLFFLLKKNNENADGFIRNYIKPALNLLQDEGLGGKRNWGLGAFKYYVENLNLKLPDPSDICGFTTLSPFLPNDYNIFNEKSKWNFSFRKGWGFSYHNCLSFKKPNIILIKEGSIFENKPEGKCKKFNLGKNQKSIFYFLYGNAFPIPVKIV